MNGLGEGLEDDSWLMPEEEDDKGQPNRVRFEGVRLTERDYMILHDLHRFNGLTVQALLRLYYDGSTYGNTRLGILRRHDIIGRKFRYSGRPAHTGRKQLVREAAIYYLRPLGLKIIGESISPRHVEPREDRLDVQVKLSDLYACLSEDLMSGREVKHEYGLPNFTPVTAYLPEPPTSLTLLSRRVTRQEKNTLKSFIETRPKPFTRNIVIARKFPANLTGIDVDDVFFVFWNRAEEVIPAIHRDPDIYTGEFLSKFRGRFPDVPVSPREVARLKFHVARMSFGELYLAEFVTGNLRLASLMQYPDRPYCLYVRDRMQLNLIRLKEGTFTVYSARDGAYYQVLLRDGRMKTRLLTLPEVHLGTVTR